MVDIITAGEIAAERQQARVSSISEAIDDLEAGIAYRIDSGLDELVRLGVFPSLWGSSGARNALCKRIAAMAVRELLEDGECALPAEVRWLHLERGQ